MTADTKPGPRQAAPQTEASEERVATEIAVGPDQPPPNPMRKILLVALALLLLLFAYHVIADRYTPYTSQGRVEAYLTQIAPEVSGDVLEVRVSDNMAVKKGQLLFRIVQRLLEGRDLGAPQRAPVGVAERELLVVVEDRDPHWLVMPFSFTTLPQRAIASTRNFCVASGLRSTNVLDASIRRGTFSPFL